MLLRGTVAPPGELLKEGHRRTRESVFAARPNSDLQRVTHLPSAVLFSTPLLRLDSAPADWTEILRDSGGERGAAAAMLAVLLLVPLGRASLALDGRGWLERGRDAAELLLCGRCWAASAGGNAGSALSSAEEPWLALKTTTESPSSPSSSSASSSPKAAPALAFHRQVQGLGGVRLLCLLWLLLTGRLHQWLVTHLRRGHSIVCLLHSVKRLARGATSDDVAPFSVGPTRQADGRR